ncbi:MAG TPA: TetR/AcrR family transcriptional regulator [Pseudonocardiaceae bacterium]|jgi:AcrR family transcriptional regulator|nr:TetR/AcrR family transcriptional regulator [Pseudonocardiaceae bacterium]
MVKTGDGELRQVKREVGPRQALVEATLNYLLEGGRPEQSLRALAAGVGVSHSLLLYHFGSTTGLLGAVHLACERRERDHLATLRVAGADPIGVMDAMWRHLADPAMWPLYRLGFALRVRADVPTSDQEAERAAWADALLPLLAALGVTGSDANDEALLWVASCRGLLWELVTGADPEAVHRAAARFATHYPGASGPDTLRNK